MCILLNPGENNHRKRVYDYCFNEQIRMRDEELMMRRKREAIRRARLNVIAKVAELTATNDRLMALLHNVQQ